MKGKTMVRAPGFEPGSGAFSAFETWEAPILPLDYARFTHDFLHFFFLLAFRWVLIECDDLCRFLNELN